MSCHGVTERQCPSQGVTERQCPSQGVTEKDSHTHDKDIVSQSHHD